MNHTSMHSQPTQSFGVSFSLSLSLIDSRRQVPSIHSTIMKLKSDKLPSQQKGGCELDHIKNVEHWVKQIVSCLPHLLTCCCCMPGAPCVLRTSSVGADDQSCFMAAGSSPFAICKNGNGKCQVVEQGFPNLQIKTIKNPRFSNE